MVSIDPLLDRLFDRDNYQCAHFTNEAWSHLVGHDLSHALDGLLLPVKDKVVDPTKIRSFLKTISKPISPCIVFMFRRGITPHLGVFWKGRILHLTEDGVRYETSDIATMFFTKVRYYVCR
jgi:hypothetical protein